MTTPRLRVILDNDWSGDPDGLFQLAHHLLSPSVDVRLVIGSHLRPDDGWAADAGRSADEAATAARRIAQLAGRPEVAVVAASNMPMPDPATPADSPAVRALIAEAMRDDPLPLVVCVGGPLTTIASAWLLEPAIADRMLVIWIGGAEYPGVPAPPKAMDVEYNLLADVPAARTVFNDAPLALWQVPRDSYRRVLMSQAELDRRVRPHGPLGAALAASIDDIRAHLGRHGPVGEAYAYGDSPLVLLTALQSVFEPDPASSVWTERPAPTIDEAGFPDFTDDGRPVRVFSRLDTRLLFEDFFAKLEAHARPRYVVQDESGDTPRRGADTPV